MVMALALSQSVEASLSDQGVFRIFKEKKVVYPTQHLSLRGVREIRVDGVRGHLKFKGQNSRPHLQLQVRHSNSRKSEDWQLAVDRRGDILYFEVISSLFGREWREQVKENEWPAFDLTLEGPARPAVISWREGEVEIVGWDKPLEISTQKGRLHIEGGRGPLHLQPLEADVRVRSHRGDVRVKGDSGQLRLESVTGDVQVNWWKGDLAFTGCRGRIQVESREGRLQVRGGRGELSVSLPSGNADIQNFLGKVRANGEETNWRVRAAAPSDLNLISKTGQVNVDWSGGARVFLTSTDGQIAASKSKYLRFDDRNGRRVWAGLKGGDAKGEVFVRTQSGGIFWHDPQSQ